MMHSSQSSTRDSGNKVVSAVGKKQYDVRRSEMKA